MTEGVIAGLVWFMAGLGLGVLIGKGIKAGQEGVSTDPAPLLGVVMPRDPVP